jgi:hypothetical protein
MESMTPAKRPCPHCRSMEVFRSHRRGTLERYVLRAIGMRAYRCVTCDSRFYGFPQSYEAPSPDAKAA